MAGNIFWLTIFGLVLVSPLCCDGIVNRGLCRGIFWNRLITPVEIDTRWLQWGKLCPSAPSSATSKVQGKEEPEGEEFYFHPFDPSVISKWNRLNLKIHRSAKTTEAPPITRPQSQALTTEFSATSFLTTTAEALAVQPTLSPKSPSFFEVSAAQNVKEGELLGDPPMSPPFNITLARSQMLSKINAYRRYHKAEPLRLSRTLTKMANRLASMIILESAPLAPPSNSTYGQTLAEIILEDGNEFTIENLLQVPELWYDQRIHFDSKSPIASSFTQLVWKSTKHIGIGVKVRHDRTVIACYYHPAGNILILKNGKVSTDEFDLNVQE